MTGPYPISYYDKDMTEYFCYMQEAVGSQFPVLKEVIGKREDETEIVVQPYQAEMVGQAAVAFWNRTKAFAELMRTKGSNLRSPAHLENYQNFIERLEKRKAISIRLLTNLTDQGYAADLSAFEDPNFDAA